MEERAWQADIPLGHETRAVARAATPDSNEARTVARDTHVIPNLARQGGTSDG